MTRDNHQGASNNKGSMSQIPNQKTQPGHGKEEISLELAELGNLKPKHEPMTQDQRKKSEEERSY